MFLTKFLEKIKHTSVPSTFTEIMCLRNNEGKYGTAREATDVNIIRRMCIECWIPKTTNTHTEYTIFIAFSPQQLLQYYIISTLRLLLHINQVNKRTIRIPPSPSPLSSMQLHLSEMTYIYIGAYFSTFFVIVCSQWRSPEHIGHSAHSNILHQHKSIWALLGSALWRVPPMEQFTHRLSARCNVFILLKKKHNPCVSLPFFWWWNLRWSHNCTLF